MSKSSRRRYFQRQHLMKANIAQEVDAQLTPLLSQTELVERNPFVPPSVEPRGDAHVRLHAFPTKEYVPSRTMGYYPFLQALPPWIDDISQQFGMQVYTQMLADPVVYASLGVYRLAIIANGYEIVPSLTREEHDYDVAAKMCDFVKENIDNLETPYDNILEQHLMALAYGSSVNEQVYKVENRKLYLKDIRDKPLQNSIFVIDSFFNTVAILTMRFPGQNFPAGSYIPIDFSAIGMTKKDEAFDLSNVIPGMMPRFKFSILSNEIKLNDERGHSALRAAYQAWWLKQQLVAEHLSMLSKWASPSLVAKTAPGAIAQTFVDSNLNPLLNVDGTPMQKSAETLLAEAIADFQNGSAVVVPSGSEVDAIATAGDGMAFVNALNFYDTQIVKGITYQSLATQEGIHQARASSDTHQDILTLGILRRKQWLANQQRREVFKRLLMYNFDLTGKRIARYVPKLNLGLGDGFPTSPEAIARLMGSGYFGDVPDSAQMEKLDERLALPRRESANQLSSAIGKTFQPKPRPQFEFAPRRNEIEDYDDNEQQ
jgi:hypothetical protein